MDDGGGSRHGGSCMNKDVHVQCSQSDEERDCWLASDMSFDGGLLGKRRRGDSDAGVVLGVAGQLGGASASGVAPSACLDAHGAMNRLPSTVGQECIPQHVPARSSLGRDEHLTTASINDSCFSHVSSVVHEPPVTSSSVSDLARSEQRALLWDFASGIVREAEAADDMEVEWCQTVTCERPGTFSRTVSHGKRRVVPDDHELDTRRSQRRRTDGRRQRLLDTSNVTNDAANRHGAQPPVLSASTQGPSTSGAPLATSSTFTGGVSAGPSTFSTYPGATTSRGRPSRGRTYARRGQRLKQKYQSQSSMPTVVEDTREPEMKQMETAAPQAEATLTPAPKEASTDLEDKTVAQASNKSKYD